MKHRQETLEQPEAKPLVILHGEIKTPPLSANAKLSKLKAAGYAITDASDFLGLSPEEDQIVNMRVALASELERVRIKKGLTQAQLAAKIGTKQSGVARMTAHPETTTLDNLIRGLVTLGEPVSKIAACLLLCTATN